VSHCTLRRECVFQKVFCILRLLLGQGGFQTMMGTISRFHLALRFYLSYYQMYLRNSQSVDIGCLLDQC
jgi:hypothetical protein